MAWQPVLPDDPMVAGWWRAADERREAEERAAVADRAMRVSALATRARRAIRDLDAVLARQARCDCVDFGYQAGCIKCRPELGRRHAAPPADHGVAARRAGVVEYGPPGRVLSVR